MSITVYTQPNCVQCTAVKRKLKDNNREYVEVALTDELRDQFKGEGLMRAPVVDVDGARHAGFQPHLL